ncbi:unnamed protein product, partial [Didymodactylos carnosus]
CQQPVLTSDGKDKLAMCSQCNYSFCKQCKEVYHSESLCAQELDLELLRCKQRKISQKLDSLAYTSQQKGFLLKEILATELIEQNTRQCPNIKCGVKIEKNGGCSHMHCARCNLDFQWEDAIIPEQPQRSILKELGDDLDEVIEKFENNKDDDKAAMLIGEVVLNRTKICPWKKCGKLNVKSGTNNWLICQHCRKSFCFQCGNPLIGRNHFGYGCRQYSKMKI